MILSFNTRGFKSKIKDNTGLIHKYGGQVYMDGANMNVQVGLTSPALIGADVCHLNLHKTFAIPHGGGGPEVGPICVAEQLVPSYQSYNWVEEGKQGSQQFQRPREGLRWLVWFLWIHPYVGWAWTYKSNWNSHLKRQLYQKIGRCIWSSLQWRKWTRSRTHYWLSRLQGIGIGMNIAKIDDYSFHAPTVSFPVAGTMMIEPTESENLDEIDRFCEAHHIHSCWNWNMTNDTALDLKCPHTANDYQWWMAYHGRKRAAFRYIRYWKQVLA